MATKREERATSKIKDTKRDIKWMYATYSRYNNWEERRATSQKL